MARLTADLKPIEQFYKFGNPQKEILRHCLSLEMAGVESVLINTGDGFEPSRSRLLEIVKDTLNIGLTVETEAGEQWIEALQEIKPSMVIFNYDDSRYEEYSGFVTRLQVKDILVAFRIKDNVEYVKKAARLKSDYIILDCGPYCDTESMNKEVEELNKIAKISSLGKKLSMGVIASGEFNKRKLKRLHDTGAVEEFILELRFFSESLLYGYGTAVWNIRSTLI
ncbi:MAG: pyridoxine 5'-phosphate synthase [Candidatus Zixiibacteriota bacterium]|nr:MAG: pyridoxine 5'-phosphate synthase [candidate division Zixibacteria bacterium]